MTNITFDELISRLPASTRLPLVDSPGPMAEAPDHKESFVAPTLLNVWPPETRTSVVLVSARGAVGKTTLAGEIASKTGGHLWPLGKFQVGHTFLEGALVKAYGDDAYIGTTSCMYAGSRKVLRHFLASFSGAVAVRCPVHVCSHRDMSPPGHYQTSVHKAPK